MNHGVLFGESIKTEKIARRRYDERKPSGLRSRHILLPLVLIITGVVLIFKLVEIQIVKGNHYRMLADSNRMRTQIISAPRGVIFDRHGEPLVFNMPGFREISKNKDGSIKTEHVEKEEALKLISQGAKNIGVVRLRQYPFKDAMSHILGYMGQISQEDLERPEFRDYPPNDWIGKSGIEEQYEYLLRGKDGKQLIEVDAMGKKLRSLGQTDPIPGQDVVLTIDAKLQQAAYDSASSMKKGAIIVSRPDGEILAMVSKPSFDANLFTLDKTYKASSTSNYTDLQDILLDSQNQPLLNRVIGGIYPPGSTFKLITAAAGLEKHIINEKYTVADTGVLKVGEFSYANWFYVENGKTEPGQLDVTRALSRSNDIFFYKLAEKINVDRLSESARMFSVGEKLGIDLGGEVAGLLPTKEWKKKTLKETWYLGDTFHYGIGQGYLLTTPLQVNTWTQAIAAEGTLYQPRLIKSESAIVKKKDFLGDKTVDLIRQGMIDSCKKGGVAFPFFDFKVPYAKASAKQKIAIDGKNFFDAPASGSAKMVGVSVACKTGTAQHGGEKTLPHAWITLFAPAYKPEVVVTVLVESGGQGSSVAGPIAKKSIGGIFWEVKNLADKNTPCATYRCGG